MFELSWTDQNGTETTIDFDLSISEAFVSPSTVSEHAVEDGAAISDGVIDGNDTITIEGLTTNTPVFVRSFGMDGAAMSTSAASVRISGQDRSVSVFQSTQQFDRVKAIDAALLALQAAKQVFTVRTSFRETPSCVIAEYGVQRDASTGDALPVTLTFRQIRIVTTQRVAVTATRQRRGQAGRNRGNQPATTTANPPPADSMSYTFLHSQGIL